MRKIFFDQQYNDHVTDKGYVLHKLLSDPEILYLLGEIQKYYPEDIFRVKSNEFSHANIQTSYLNGSIEIREKISRIVRDTLTPHIEALLDDYRIIACGLFLKPPNGGWLDLHYHPTVVEDLKHWVIDIWCPLQATDFTNGTFCIVPESHRIFPMIIDCSPKEPPFYHGYAEEIRNHYSVAIPARAGEAVLFEDSLLHWSPRNMTESPRYAIHCTCIPREASPVCIYPKRGDDQYMEMYEVSDRFFIERTHIQQRDNLKLLEVLPTSNRSYTFEEFKRRLENSSEIRKTIRF